MENNEKEVLFFSEWEPTGLIGDNEE